MQIYGHLALEKIFKAHVVKKSKKPAPYIHNLLKLAKLANITLSERNQTLLASVNDFNMESRYPDTKLRFYDLCTKSFTEEYYKKIMSLYKKLCLSLKPKKS